MKLSQLLSQRPDLLRRVRLANLAFAYQTLEAFAARIVRAQLRGLVTLRPIDPTAERYCVTLTALEASQSIIEEHFSDEDLLVLADVLGFATGHPGYELTFRIDDIFEFITPLRAELIREGVEIDPAGAQIAEQSNQP